MGRSLAIRLHPATVSWAVAFGFLEVGVASCLLFLGVAAGLTLAWVLVAAGVFAAYEPGFFAWLWLVVARDHEEPPEKRPVTSKGDDSSPEAGESGKEEATDPDPGPRDERLLPPSKDEERFSSLIDSQSSKIHRIFEVSVAVALAGLAFLGSHWEPGRMRPPDTAALQRSLDQIRSDLKKCTEKACCSVSGDDASGGGGFGGDVSHPDPKLKQEIADAVKEALKSSDTFGTGFTILGISGLVLLVVVLGVAAVFLFRKRPEAAAPLGAVGLAATAIKEAEHLARLDTTSYRIAEGAFLLLLVGFALLAWQKIRSSEGGSHSARGGEEEGKGKIESPLSLLFSALVLLWALIAVCYRYEPAPAPGSPPPPPEKVKLDSKLLPSVHGFVAKRWDALISSQSKKEIAQQVVGAARDEGARPDDLLVLLGSADCTAVHTPKELTNKALAQNRATWLKVGIENTNWFNADHVIAGSLYQNEKCTESADLRAVFPVLIRMEKDDRAGSAAREVHR